MGISLPPVPSGSPQVISGGGAPDPYANILQSILAGQQISQQRLEEKGRNSRSSAEMEIQKAHIALLQAQEKTKQAALAHQTEIANQQGEATRLFLEHAMPQLAATGQLNQLLGIGGGSDAAMQGVQSAANAIPQAQQMQQGGGGNQQYQNFLSHMSPEALVAFQKDIVPVLQQAKQDRVREQIAAKFPVPDNESPAQALGRMQKLSAAYASAGDHTMVASLAESIGALRPSTKQYEWFQKKDGTTVYLPKEEGSQLRLGKPVGSTTGFGFGPGGPMGAIRAISAVAGMNDADQKMKRFELQIAEKKANYVDMDYFRGHLATLYNDATKDAGIFGHIVPFFGTAVGSSVLARLNRTNPDLANYLQAASQWALEESLLSNRPSDFRVKMDEFISAIKPDAKVQSIHDLWRSRAVRLGALNHGVPTLQRLLDRAASMPNMPGTTIVPDPESP